MIPEKVHLVGSVWMDSVSEVFRTIGPLLGKRLHAIPDGEVGGRRLWVGWQFPLFRANALLRVVPPPPGSPENVLPVFTLAPGVKGEDVSFGELGYYREARGSYLDYLEAREAKAIAEGVRFQVCLPTPLGVVSAFFPGKDFPAIFPSYQKAMLKEVESICAAIPHKDLSIQWDVCVEMVQWDGGLKAFLPPGIPMEQVRGMIVGSIKKYCEAVPRDVELGVHLCYGDLDGEHFVQPKDAAKEVELANAIMAASTRPLDFIHFPVPPDRFDDAFYEPMKNLKLTEGTELYLGLVSNDGADNTRKRIAVAQKYVSKFGIGTECGMGRVRKRDAVESLLKIHAQCSHEAAA